MNRDEIKQWLPHREPMLLVDEMTLQGDTAYGSYTVTGDEWFVQGHFPGNPVVPGVIQLEILAQSACALIGGGLEPGKTPMYAGIDKTRFRRAVKPGDLVETRSVLLRNKMKVYIVSGEARVGGELCASGEFTFIIA